MYFNVLHRIFYYKDLPFKIEIINKSLTLNFVTSLSKALPVQEQSIANLLVNILVKIRRICNLPS